jgi:hypothetical protein
MFSFAEQKVSGGDEMKGRSAILAVAIAAAAIPYIAAAQDSADDLLKQIVDLGPVFVLDTGQ